jgi:hypothetical protein
MQFPSDVIRTAVRVLGHNVVDTRCLWFGTELPEVEYHRTLDVTVDMLDYLGGFGGLSRSHFAQKHGEIALTTKRECSID